VKQLYSVFKFCSRAHVVSVVYGLPLFAFTQLHLQCPICADLAVTMCNSTCHWYIEG